MRPLVLTTGSWEWVGSCIGDPAEAALRDGRRVVPPPVVTSFPREAYDGDLVQYVAAPAVDLRWFFRFNAARKLFA